MNLSDFVPAIGRNGYVARRPSVMSDERWRWLWRQNKARFIRAGAAVVLGGQVYVHPGRADTVILKVGREQAARLVEEMA